MRNHKQLTDVERKKLIQAINVLGPWSHGYFDLKNGLKIEDQDLIQRNRLIKYREYFIKIIQNHFGRSSLPEKSLCDVGCNAGYFLFELFKQFKFKKAVGFEPRSSNLKKAQFIASFFKLPRRRYTLKQFDILSRHEQLPLFDIVIFPSVLHHLDNPLLALRNLYAMTGELCIVDTLVLSDDCNTPEIAQRLELKDEIYGKVDNAPWGVVGYKLESAFLDGSTVNDGMVAIPTVTALTMMLKQAGFSQVSIYKTPLQLKKEVYNRKLHRDINAVICVASKDSNKRSTSNNAYGMLERMQEQELNTTVPLSLINPLYSLTENACVKPTKLVKDIYFWAYNFDTKAGAKAFSRVVQEIGSTPYFSILTTIKYAPDQKIKYEYAKSCFLSGNSIEAKRVCQILVETMNLDWRTVYKGYFLLALICKSEGDLSRAKHYAFLSVQAYNAYAPANKMLVDLRNVTNSKKTENRNKQ